MFGELYLLDSWHSKFKEKDEAILNFPQLFNDLLRRNLKGKRLIHWSTETLQAFEKCIRNFSYPAPDAVLRLFTDASDFVIGAVLRQHVREECQALEYFVKNLSTAKCKYGAYERKQKQDPEIRELL